MSVISPSVWTRIPSLVNTVQFTHYVIMVLTPVCSLFYSEFFTECIIVRHLSNYSIIFVPRSCSSCLRLFIVFPPLLSLPLSFLQKCDSEVSSNAICDQSSYTSWCSTTCNRTGRCRHRNTRNPRRGSAAARLLGLWVRVPPGSMDFCLLWVLSIVSERSLRRSDHSSRGGRPTECNNEAP
jgi:hypothetical protein